MSPADSLAAVPSPAGRSGRPVLPRPSGSAGRTLAGLCDLLELPLPAPGPAHPDAAPAAAGATATIPASVELSGVTLDSRQVRRGDLYAALPGAQAHGADFVDLAAARGAVAVLTDAEGADRAARAGLPVLVVPDPRAGLGRVASWVYGDPASHLLLLGVTGTNGKTTTTYLLDAGLRACGRVTGMVGTIETRVAGASAPSVRTTPESPDVHALLALMLERGVQVCSMEVSSHALALHRVDGITFDVVGFTNLSQDHLDFHGTLAEYFAAKASLFTPARARRGVVCVDDEWGRRLAAAATVPVTTLSATGGDADWRVSGLEVTSTGAPTSFDLTGPAGLRVRVSSPLPGAFNVANTALAAAMLVTAGFAPAPVVRGLAAGGEVPGRMERVQSTDPEQPLAVVDYAHTPAALTAALRALRPSTPGRLVVVVGAGGDRDRGKRAAMGAAAAADADLVVVTDDNPRTESPGAIRAAVLAGARAVAGAEVVEVPDRAQAVLAAVRATAGRADTVLVAGKGHEQGQEVAGEVLPFDDRQVLREALERLADPTGRP